MYNITLGVVGGCKICTEDYAPVCGTDGETHKNKCTMESKACENKTKITVSYKGECKGKSNVSITVEPVYNGPVLSGHPLLSGQFSKSRFFAHTNAIFVTCVRRPPLLSGCGHPVAVLCLSFFVIFTCIKRPPLNGN